MSTISFKIPSIIALIVFLFSCKENIVQDNCYFSKNSSEYITEYGKTLWLTPRKITASSFLKHISCVDNSTYGFHEIIIENDFPENWITKADIDSMMKLIQSTEKCHCVLNPLSSVMSRDSAELGGYVAMLVKSYKENTKIDIGPGLCPKTNSQEATEFMNWWETKK
jgi:hypothetical protein